jgi:hypothetical protein
LKFGNPAPAVEELHAIPRSDETEELEVSQTMDYAVRSLERDYSAAHLADAKADRWGDQFKGPFMG